ncbi:STAS domain-containing protein [Dactylosporangium sp. CA-052675]|uniref:STAS domain-containing protein n=1 Tax=Dactylosporangium sp. CA-052675 TaxID=3239927 RepID=UPI003D8CE81D
MRSSFLGDGGNPADTVTVRVLDGDPAVVRVTGRLLFDTLRPLAEALDGLTGVNGSRIVLDLAEVPMCDSSALNLLVRTRSAVDATGGWLRLASVRPMVASVLEITNLTWILPVFDTPEEAAAQA